MRNIFVKVSWNFWFYARASEMCARLLQGGKTMRNNGNYMHIYIYIYGNTKTMSCCGVVMIGYITGVTARIPHLRLFVWITEYRFQVRFDLLLEYFIISLLVIMLIWHFYSRVC